MTEYVAAPQKWQAIEYDGTNVNDVATAAQSAGAFILTGLGGGDSLLVFESSLESPSEDYSYVGALSATGSSYVSPTPWLLYIPAPGFPNEKSYLAIAGWNSTHDGPAGWDAV